MATKESDDALASHWGIDPVPLAHRKLSALNLGVLWGDLGIGVLVMVAGAILVAPAPPNSFGFGLGLGPALIAIVLGSIIGSVLLGIGGVIGTREARPTMALLRPVLGVQGSWVPSMLNAAQLIGWTAVELWAMARIASTLGDRLFGLGGFGIWLAFFTVVCLAMTLWGPLGVVRAWMQRFGAWVVLAIGIALTALLLTRLSDVSLSGGSGGWSILGLPMDLVIAIPVSWIPLVADYNRFSSDSSRGFWGTTLGMALANSWFYMLGALLVITQGAAPDPQSMAAGILAIGGAALSGAILLLGLLVGETDEAFADIYSGAVSLRNVFPRVDNRLLVIIVTVLGAGLAGRFSMLAFEGFLFLLGSVFVPLLGVWFVDYYHLGNRIDVPGIRWAAFLPWVAGFLLYHWIAPSPFPAWADAVKAVVGVPLSQKVAWLGASLPSFLLAAALHALVQRGREGSKVRQEMRHDSLQR